MALRGDVGARLHSFSHAGRLQDDFHPQHRDHRQDHPGAPQETTDPGTDGDDTIMP